MNNRQFEERLRDLRRISDYDEVLLAVQDLVECVQAIHERVKDIEEWHDDRVDAMHEADEAMEDASEWEHGPY